MPTIQGAVHVLILHLADNVWLTYGALVPILFGRVCYDNAAHVWKQNWVGGVGREACLTESHQPAGRGRAQPAQSHAVRGGSACYTTRASIRERSLGFYTRRLTSLPQPAERWGAAACQNGDTAGADASRWWVGAAAIQRGPPPSHPESGSPRPSPALAEHAAYCVISTHFIFVLKIRFWVLITGSKGRNWLHLQFHIFVFYLYATCDRNMGGSSTSSFLYCMSKFNKICSGEGRKLIGRKIKDCHTRLCSRYFELSSRWQNTMK